MGKVGGKSWNQLWGSSNFQ